jgi:lipopolysaccharide transport system ATP-binding protein
VIQDITFTVHPGEAVGIIGINGAGKSTLLKMITGTTRPTAGSVKMVGRVAALLELGMGFHSDFTGRQNVFMAGQLLGYSIKEISDLMPNIEEFAEIGDYIDRPVRIYSSGMQVRLAFSIATATRPDILIVDEALSVGDAYFQHKSFDRIKEYRKQGTTLLFVSHDKSAIQSLCDRVLLLNSGRLEMEGQPEVVMDYYNALLSSHQNLKIQQEAINGGAVQTISGGREAVIKEVFLLNDLGEDVEVVSVGQRVRLGILAEVMDDIPELVAGYMIKDRMGQSMFGTNTHYLNKKCINLKMGAKILYTFDFSANLGEGSYSIAVALHTGHSHISKNYEWRDMALFFSIINSDKSKFVGGAWLPPEVNLHNVDE